MSRFNPVYVLVLVACLCGCPFSAAAAVLAAPVGGAAISLPPGHVLCDVPGSWTPEAAGTRIRPPLDATQIGKSVTVRVAPLPSGCAASKDTDTFAATGPLPVADRRTVDLWIDEGHLDLRGTSLEGSRIEWEAKGEHGSDVCNAPTVVGAQQSCSYAVSKKLSADPNATAFRLLPAGAPKTADIYDASGKWVPPDSFTIPASRVIVASNLTAERHVDLSTGEAVLGLTHPMAIASADCDSSRCDLLEHDVRVRSLGVSSRSLTLRLRLAPHVFLRSGDNFVQVVNIPLDVTYCPVSLVSPAPLRDTDDVQVVVRVDARCAANPESLRWMANGNGVPVMASEVKDDFVYMLLGIGRLSTEKLTLAALRGTAEAAVIGQITTATAPPAQLRVSLHLPGYGEIDFIPTNRSAIVSATAVGLHGKIVALPVDGAYDVRSQEGHTEVRGTSDGGYVLMRFALRDESLPGHMDEADLAHFTAYVQRALHAVNMPAPIGDTNAKLPIAEVLCNDEHGNSTKVVPGIPLHIPFAQRDGCRLVIHPNRISSADGEQHLEIDVDVTGLGGASRSEGHFTQRLALSHDAEPRIIWIRGVKAQFDRINVRLTHVTEDSRYMRGGTEGTLAVPSAQWTIVAENTRWRFYATASIPIQLYRFSNEQNGSGNGPLALNLGVLTRFTWVTRDGTEGFLGLESGVMGMGLATYNTRQLNIVGGLGMGVPLGNAGQPTQASINIHAWVAYRLGSESAPLLDQGGVATTQYISLKPWAFIFGPSVTFGNVGFDI